MADVANIKINGTTYSVKDSVARNAAGGPNVAATKAAMTDKSKVYVYTGTESGMTKGNWYYWNGSAWTSGGVYQSTGLQTDTTLTVSGMAADAKVTGDGFNDLRNQSNSAFEDIYDGLSVVPYLPSGDTTKFTSAIDENFWGVQYLFKRGWIESITVNRISALSSGSALVIVFITDTSLNILKKATVVDASEHVVVPINYDCQHDFYVFIRCFKMRYGYVDGVSRPYYNRVFTNDGGLQEGGTLTGSWQNSNAFTFDYVVNRKAVTTRIKENKENIELFTDTSVGQQIISDVNKSSLGNTLYGNSFEYPPGYVESITLGFNESTTTKVYIWLLDSNHKVLKKIIDYANVSSASAQAFQIGYFAEVPFNVVVYAVKLTWQNSTIASRRYSLWNGALETYGYIDEGEKLFADWSTTSSTIQFDITVNYSEPQYYKNVSYKRRDRLYTFQDAFKSWLFGEKFPILVLGDSTTDGDTTTSDTHNVIGTDHQDPNTYTTKLQSLLREALNNNVLRIYNGGFSGKDAGWTLQNLGGIIWNNDHYNDCKIVIISHGINEYVTDLNRYNQFKHYLQQLILECFSHGVQPAIMTTQAGMENYNRWGWKQMSLADKLNRELAETYNLEVIDKNALTLFYNIYSGQSISTIIPDACHYSDVGHAYVAGLMFASIVPFTVWIEDGESILGFDDERIQTELEYSSFTDYMWKDVKIITPTNGFKLEASCSKEADTTLMDFWVFIHSKTQKSLVSYCNTPNVQTVTVDGTVYQITEAQQTLTTLDLGLHHIVVSSEASTDVNYLGLKLIDA